MRLYLLGVPVVVLGGMLTLGALPVRRVGGRAEVAPGTINGPLSVTGPSTLNGDLTVNGDAGVSNNARVNGTFGVNGASTFGSAISSPVLDGGALIGSTLNTAGSNVLGGETTQQGYLSVRADAGFHNATHTGTVSSSVPTGTNGFACTTNGCRYDFGTGANDYGVSDGTNVSFAGGVLAAGDVVSSGFVQSVTASNGFRSSGSTTALLIGFPNDGASAVGTRLRAGTALTNATAVVTEFMNGTNRVGAVMWDGAFQFDAGMATPAHAEGKVYYDATAKALSYFNENSSVSMQIGQETYERVWNNSGSTIANGAAVYISGVDGTSGLATVALADADGADPVFRAIGLVTSTSCTNNSFCYVTVLGKVNGLDTSALSTGPVYLSTTAGALTSSIPANPAYNVEIGTVLVVNASTGVVRVKAGIIPLSGGTGVSRGSFAAGTTQTLPEGANLQGAFYALGVTATTRFRTISCICRTTGSGGTNGIFVDLMANGVSAANCELTGGDANACNDSAGTVLRCDFNRLAAATTNYTIQVTNTTDCAGNPADCWCNISIEG